MIRHHTYTQLLLVIVSISALLCRPSQAREVAKLNYQKMFDASDLVVIATPTLKTADTKERTVLSDIMSNNAAGVSSAIRVMGVETHFRVSVILKGDKLVKRFVLHHYRETTPAGVEVNGPSLVSFDPSDPTNRRSWLLFLVRETDGRYAPTLGQTDPGYQAIHPLPYEPQ